MTEPLAVCFTEVDLLRDGRHVLRSIDWTVGKDERWVVLGPNGSGKTSLLRLAGAQLHPSHGAVEVLGRRLGKVDVRELRARIGFVSGAITRTLRPELSAVDVVMTGLYAALEPWWHTYSDDDRSRARALLADAGMEGISDRSFGVISEGERQQVLLARALMRAPELLLLDEPAAGLDLGARERLVVRLGRLAADVATPPLVLVTHHTEEIPVGATHIALLRGGELVTKGPLEESLTADAVSAAFGVPVRLRRDEGRWISVAVSGR